MGWRLFALGKAKVSSEKPRSPRLPEKERGMQDTMGYDFGRKGGDERKPQSQI